MSQNARWWPFAAIDRRQAPRFWRPTGRGCQKMIAIGAKADFTHQARMLDGGTLPPLPVNKLPDCEGGSRGNRKVVSIGAEAVPTTELECSVVAFSCHRSPTSSQILAEFVEAITR